MTDRRSKDSDTYEDKLIAFVWKAKEDAAAIERVRRLLAHPRDYRGNGSEWNECRDAVLRALDDDM